MNARSPRISDIANAMDGNYDANYKSIQRFIEDDKPGEALHRVYNEDSDYVLGDPTDIERPQAGKTEYVGRLKSKKLGFTILFLATPYRGRAIPFSFITYSSRTIGAELSSRNMEHIKSVAKLKELIGSKILVLDREFSYELLFEEVTESGISIMLSGLRLVTIPPYWMKKMAALLVLAYVIGFLIGEQIRDWEYSGQTPPLPMDSRLCWNNKGYSI